MEIFVWRLGEGSRTRSWWKPWEEMTSQPGWPHSVRPSVARTGVGRLVKLTGSLTLNMLGDGRWRETRGETKLGISSVSFDCEVWPGGKSTMYRLNLRLPYIEPSCYLQHNGAESLIYFTINLMPANIIQSNSQDRRQSYLLHWRAPPAHLEDGAAGLDDGHQDQGGDTGNDHVELHIGVNLVWLTPLITVIWCDWNHKYCSVRLGKFSNLPTLSKERDSASTWRCSILPPLTVSFRASSTVSGSGSASNWFLSTMTTRVESNSPWPPL